jgi:crotonobetainyl-CoA:carnitine CoA-transferase CaiB-like acyl-CoA transferase
MIRTDSSLPLNGIRVLELGHAVMGPTCGLILADMGAEVIKVERAPDGDDTRRLIGFGSGFFPFFNRNKKSITIDLKSEKGKAVLRKLVRSADVFIENFAPGTVDRLGFGYDEVSRINPRLIYCSLKGFMKGPYEKRPALDEVVQMMGGLAYMTGPLGQPLRCGASVIDIMGGSYGVIGILVGLYNREKTGRGEYIIASLYESTAFLVGQHMTYSAVSGKPAPPMPNRVSDKRLTTNNDRIAQREWLIPELQQVFKKLEKSEILEQCEKAGIPFAPIAKPEDLFEDPHLNQSGSLVDTTLPGGVKAKLPKIPVRIGSHDFGLRNNPPRVGEGSREVLKSIGISDEEIDELQKAGTLAFSS